MACRFAKEAITVTLVRARSLLSQTEGVLFFMANTLSGKRIAILATDGVEQVEMTEPRKALEEAGATTELISPAKGKLQAWKHLEKGDTFPVDVSLDAADAAQYDALVLPGGVANPDQLRMLPQALQFVREFFAAGKPVAAICHGPWTLIDAGVVGGRTITSWPSLKADLANAGAKWVDEEVVVDDGLVSSRKPSDLPEFNRRMIEQFAKAYRAAEQETRS